jgi:sugar lactone lactonase YvrE
VTANFLIGTAAVFDGRRCSLGEGPVWDSASGRVLWVDILNQKVHWARLSDGETGEIAMPSHVGAFLPGEGAIWWAFLVDGVYRFDEASGGLEKIAHFPHSLPPLDGVDQMRANDAAVSPWGDVLCGTMPYNPDAFPGVGSLYLFSGHDLAHVLSNVTISNGIGWSGDQSKMFFVDTPTGRVDQFDVDEAGRIDNRRIFATIDPDLGFPDGLAVDSEGFVWVALWAGGRIQRLAPDGSLAGFIELPCRQVTSCAFVGDDLKTLIITTAAIDDDNDDDAGLTYFFDAPVPGVPSFRVKS